VMLSRCRPAKCLPSELSQFRLLPRRQEDGSVNSESSAGFPSPRMWTYSRGKWIPANRNLRLKHFQTMLKTKLNVLTLRKEPLPTVIFHEPEAIELCSATPHTKSRTHAGYKVGSHEPDNPQIQP
ncbi:hypothetical protein CHARACLAT_018104, partial [Characodon lateralis]|nr:hypothetical protein [Characodon lateralis]